MTDTRRLITAIVLAMAVLIGWQMVTFKIWGMPPQANAGEDHAVQASGPEGTMVVLDGTASRDSNSTPGTNDDIVTFLWYENLGQRTERYLGSGEHFEVVLKPGFHEITLVVTDHKDRSATDEVLITVDWADASGLTPVEAPAPDGSQAALQPTMRGADPQQQADQGFVLVGPDAVEMGVLGSERPEAGYNLAIHLTSSNACVLAADVTEAKPAADPNGPQYRYRKALDSDLPYPLLRQLDPQTGEPLDGIDAGAPRDGSLITTRLTLLRGNEVFDIPLEPHNWYLRMEEGENQERAIFWLTLTENGQDLLKLEKILTLDKGRYDLELVHRVHNLTNKTIRLSIEQFGAAGMQREDSRTDYRKIVAVSKAEQHYKVDVYPRSKLFKRQEPAQLIEGPDSKQLIYAAVVNKYFACIMGLRADQQQTTDLLDRVEAITTLGREEAGADLITRWVSLPFDIAPKAQHDLAFDLYFGPKLKGMFKNDPLYVERAYTKVMAADFMCPLACLAVVVDPLTNLMVGLLKALYRVLPNYGLAIIIMVLIVRVLLHPITKKGQVGMVKMQKNMSRLQPKMQALEQQFGNDKQRLQQEKMRLYRDEGINPMGQIMTCLPMGLQMPIWIALWTSLNTMIELRHEPFVLWIRDLAGPDALIHFGHASWIYQHTGWIPFIGPLDAFNLLPLILGVSMYLQQRFTPKPASPGMGGTDQQKQQAMMMNFMSVFFTFLFYNMPAGLNLYIGASNIFGMLESWRIRKHVRQEQDQVQLVKAAPAQPSAASKIQSRLGGWIAKLAHEADDAKKLRTKKKRPPRR